jgi:polyhydroxyalkanoate synthesis regulator phasin
MTTIADGLKDVFLAGVGAMALGAEKTQELVEQLIAKGEITVEQGKEINSEVLKRAQATAERVGQQTQAAADEAAHQVKVVASHLGDQAKTASELAKEQAEAAVSMARSQTEMAADAFRRRPGRSGRIPPTSPPL